jgi:NADH-quinone oxidoreductase subunit A
MSATVVAAYLALFLAVGIGFLFANLLVGKFLRPHEPNVEKLEVYECGEPTIGSSFVQFDLRFYVVALLFIIFDVEVAFFFPWATVFGKATHLMDPALAKNQALVTSLEVPGKPNTIQLSPKAKEIYRQLGVPNPELPDSQAGAETNIRKIQENATQLAQTSIIDIGVFFAVLLVGFAYVWRRGDLDWVRALTSERAIASIRPPPQELQEPVLAS